MAGHDYSWAERRRRIAMRPNAHLDIRHDAWRFMPPGSPRYFGRDVVKYFWPEPLTEQHGGKAAAPDLELHRVFDAEIAAEIADLRGLIADLRLHMERRRFEQGRKYSPDQPRVPAGSSEGGQWTTEGATSSSQPHLDDSRIRLAAAEKPPLGRLSRLTLALEAAKTLIEAFRSDNLLRDLFQKKTGAVTVTTIDGQDIFGSNSTSPLYRTADLTKAEQLIARYVEEHPEDAEKARLRQSPIDAFIMRKQTS